MNARLDSLRGAAARMFRLALNNPDYLGAIISGYGLVGLQIVVQIVLVPFYLHTLGAYWFSVLMVIFSIVSLVSYGMRWLQGGVTISISKASIDDNSSRASQLYTGLNLVVMAYTLVVLAVVLTAAALFSAYWAGNGHSPSTAPTDMAPWPKIFIALACYVTAAMAVTVELWVLMAVRRQRAANLFLIASIIMSVAMLVPWLMSGGGVAGVLASFAISMTVTRVAIEYYRRRIAGVRFAWVSPREGLAVVRSDLLGRDWTGFFSYGMLVTVLMADVSIIGFLGGALLAGQFVLVWKIAEVMILMLWRLADHLKPELIHMAHRGDRERLVRTYNYSLRLIWLLSLVGGLLYAVFGKWLVTLWVGEAAAPEGWAAYALAGSAVVWMGSAYLPEAFAFLLGHVRSLARIKAIEVASKLVLLLALFPLIDYRAPLAAINIIYVMGLIFAYLSLGRRSLSTPAK